MHPNENMNPGVTTEGNANQANPANQTNPNTPATSGQSVPEHGNPPPQPQLEINDLMPNNNPGTPSSLPPYPFPQYAGLPNQQMPYSAPGYPLDYQSLISANASLQSEVTRLTGANETLAREFNGLCEQTDERHRAELEQRDKDHQDVINHLNESHQSEIKRLKDSHTAEIEELKKKSPEYVLRLVQELSSQFQNANALTDGIQQQLTEAVTALRNTTASPSQTPPEKQQSDASSVSEEPEEYYTCGKCGLKLESPHVKICPHPHCQTPLGRNIEIGGGLFKKRIIERYDVETHTVTNSNPSVRPIPRKKQ